MTTKSVTTDDAVQAARMKRLEKAWSALPDGIRDGHADSFTVTQIYCDIFTVTQDDRYRRFHCEVFEQIKAIRPILSIITSKHEQTRKRHMMYRRFNGPASRYYFHLTASQEFRRHPTARLCAAACRKLRSC